MLNINQNPSCRRNLSFKELFIDDDVFENENFEHVRPAVKAKKKNLEDLAKAKNVDIYVKTIKPDVHSDFYTLEIRAEKKGLLNKIRCKKLHDWNTEFINVNLKKSIKDIGDAIMKRAEIVVAHVSDPESEREFKNYIRSWES